MAWVFPPIAVSTAAAIAVICGFYKLALSAGFMKVRLVRRNRKCVCHDTLFGGSSDYSVNPSDSEI